MDAFLSFIGLWPLNWAPRYWACCWGQFIDIRENNALFALLGTTYGGDGRNNFKLPDFRGRVPVGYGSGIGLSEYLLGWSGGFEAIKLNQAQLPSHTHIATISSIDVKFKASAQAGTESVPGTNNAKTLGATKAAMGSSDSLYNSDTATVEMNGISTNGGTVTVQDTGYDDYHENRQPYLVTNYIMCMNGIFPTRQ